jgi:hypothetical protein
MAMVNGMFNDDAMPTEALEFARRLAAGPRVAQEMIKRTVYQFEHLHVRTSLDLVSSHMATAMTTADAAGVMQARSEGREPVFRGA